MTPIIDTLLAAARLSPRDRPTCLACGRRMSPAEPTLTLRGGERVHRACATYVTRRRRSGSDRLGYPQR